jgi:hypothetical protein
MIHIEILLVYYSCFISICDLFTDSPSYYALRTDPCITNLSDKDLGTHKAAPGAVLDCMTRRGETYASTGNRTLATFP